MRKKLSWIIYIIVIIFMMLLQTSFLPQFSVFKTKPDLVLLFIISVGLLKGSGEGTAAGVFAGIISGLLSQNIWGLYGLAYCLAGFFSGFIGEKMEPDNYLLPLMTSTVGSIGFVAIFLLTGQFLGFFYASAEYLGVSLIFAAYNMFLSIPVFLISKYFLVSPGPRLDMKSMEIKNNYLIR